MIGLAALAGDRIGREHPGVLDQVDAVDPLGDAEHLAEQDGATERPPVALGPAAQRIEVAVERLRARRPAAGRDRHASAAGRG